MPQQNPPERTNEIERIRVADQIARVIKRDILKGSLQRGAKLPAERDLARRYGVSGATIREATRSLSTLGLVDVRHGSGAYVTADTVFLVATTLGAIIQLGKLGPADVLSVLSTLNRQAAVEAVNSATEDDHENLCRTLAAVDDASNPAEAAAALRAFHSSLVAGAHNALLAALCGFLTDIQVELALSLADGSMEIWHMVLNKLKPSRTQLVHAVLNRDIDRVITNCDLFNRTANDVIVGLPRAIEVHLTDPQLRDLLSNTVDRID